MRLLGPRTAARQLDHRGHPATCATRAGGVRSETALLAGKRAARRRAGSFSIGPSVRWSKLGPRANGRSCPYRSPNPVTATRPPGFNARQGRSPSGRHEFAIRFVRLSKRGGYANALKGSDKEFQHTLEA